MVASADDVMARAVEQARAGLTDLRRRVLAQSLPLDAAVLVKHRIPVGEHTLNAWAWVTDWRDPGRIVGMADNDVAGRSPPVRRGGTVTVDVDSVVDWAIQTSTDGIVEGYWTSDAVERGRRTTAR